MFFFFVDSKPAEHETEPLSNIVKSDLLAGRDSPLAAVLDPNAFSLSLNESKPPKAKPKFTPENFGKTATGIAAPVDDDPLSSLDPLWSLKK